MTAQAFNMDTAEGAVRLYEALDDLIERIDQGALLRGTLESELTKTLASVSRDHPEATSPQVRERVYRVMDAVCDRMEWPHLR